MAERRFIEQQAARVNVEERADDTPMLVGYGAVFYRADDPGTEFKLFSDLVERIAPGAFDGVLQRPDDVRGLFNHNPDHLLGRTLSKTMRLSVDGTGLKYEIDLGDSQTARDVAAAVKRGDLTGSSFSFRVLPDGQRFDTQDGVDVRWIENVEVFDVGPVTFPAYEATTTGVRSGDAEDAKSAREAWRESEQSAKDARARQARVVAVRTKIA